MMKLDYSHAVTISAIGAECPLDSIEDDSSYRTAIKVLDRLFVLEHPKTAAELEYFRTLARLTHHYEMEHHDFNSWTGVPRVEGVPRAEGGGY